MSVNGLSLLAGKCAIVIFGLILVVDSLLTSSELVVSIFGLEVILLETLRTIE